MKKPTKILVTEDEMVVALDLERRLTRLGYECTLAPSGDQAVELAATHKPDIVLMDICLPGELDGIAAAERIRLHHNLPIIYLTANADEHTLQRAELTHPASYLLKPFKERELHICIEMALINHALHQELRVARTELEKTVLQRTAELIKTNEALRKEIRSHQETLALVREQASLLDKTRDAIFVRSNEGRILYWNAGAERLYGHAKAQAEGRLASALLGLNPDTETLAIDQCRYDGRWIGEIIQLHASGAERIVESRWTFMPDKDAFLIVETDISERKKIEAQFLRVQRLESIGALAGGISHDLNNVFTPLIMTAQLLIEGAEDEKTSQLANIIMTSARHGSDLVKQVLHFVRGNQGENLPFRLEHLVKDITNLLRETFPKNIRIRSSYSPDLWSVVGDATRLHQVLMNLSVNARDAMPAGGELKITLQNFIVDETFARLHGEAQPGKYIRCDVTDTGTGMTEDVCQKVFDPFFTTKAPGQGTGLGLATVRTIVNGHQGFIDLKSTPGVGTCFQVYLPACDENESRTTSPAVTLPRGHGELVLIADNEHAVREIVKTTLEDCGYRTLLADDGISALSLFAQQKNEIRCVLIDRVMPNLDGFICAQAIRQISRDAAIILTSAATEPETSIDRYRSLPAVFLPKPFSKTDLLQVLADSLTPGTAGAKP